MTTAMLLVVYIAVVGLATVRARQSSTKVFYLLAFAVNAAAICWLFFLFRFLTSDEDIVRGIAGSGNSWLPWGCLALALLLIPVSIVSLARGERAGQHEMTPEERKEALEQVRRRAPANTAILIISVFWMVFIGEGTFGYLRSHLWMIVLGIGASAVVGWIAVTLINHRRLSHKGAS
jgi:heme A synthase